MNCSDISVEGKEEAGGKRRMTSYEDYPYKYLMTSLHDHPSSSTPDKSDLDVDPALADPEFDTIRPPSTYRAISLETSPRQMQENEILECINLTLEPSRTNPEALIAITHDDFIPNKNKIQDMKLFKVAPFMKKVAFFRNVANVIAMKPLDLKSQSNPSRIHFVPDTSFNFIRSGDKIRIFMQSVDRQGNAFDLIVSYAELGVDTSGLCRCLGAHGSSAFCVMTKGQEGSWLTTQNPTFEITVKDLDSLNLQFATLINQTSLQKPYSSSLHIQKLTFQVESTLEIYEQTFYIKSVKAPSRDISLFVETLTKRKIVDEQEVREAQRWQTQPKKKCALKIHLGAEYEQLLRKQIIKYGGKLISYDF